MQDVLTSPPSQELQAVLEELKNLEDRLKTKYEEEWGCFIWHGGLSFQRIVFQDPEFAEKIASPLFVKALFYKLYTDYYNQISEGITPESFSGPLTFPQMVLEGLANNSLDFLLSASPNWRDDPTGISEFSWHGSGLNPSAETPHLLSPNKQQDIQ